MFVGNSVVPIAFQLEQVAALVEETLRKKNWNSFERGEIKLVLTPFYLFYYDAVFPKEGPSEKTERGRLALNAETAELSKQLAESMPAYDELVKELPDDYPLVVRKPVFSRQEAEKIALLKTASLLGVDRKNLILTGLKMVYYPIWLAFVTVAGETKQLEISAVSGQVFGEESVPEREKGFVEITKETLDELKQPGAWLKYSKEIAGIAGEKLAGSPDKNAPILRKPALWLALALIAIIIAIALYL